jgi:hypothetical protein
VGRPKSRRRNVWRLSSLNVPSSKTLKQSPSAYNVEMASFISGLLAALVSLFSFAPAAPPHIAPQIGSTEPKTIPPPSARGTITRTCSDTTQLTATIDKRSLITTSTNPTITGTVSNVTNSDTTIYIAIFSGSRQVFRSGFFGVVHNLWSIPVYQGSLSPGIYTVFVYDHLYQCNDKLRTTGTLTVKA